MAGENLPRTYGSSRIGGHASVQQGDRQVTNHIKIEAAYITLQDALNLPRVRPSRQALRRRYARVHSSSDREGQRMKSGLKTTHKEGDAIEETSEVAGFQGAEDEPQVEGSCGRAEGTGWRPCNQSTTFPGDSQSIATQFIGNYFHSNAGTTLNFPARAAHRETIAEPKMSAGNTRFRSALSPASHSVQTKDPSTINFRQRLSQASPFPKVSSFGLPLTIKQPELRTHNDSVVPVEGGSLIHPRQQSCTEHDLALLFAGIMSYIFGQTVSVNDVSIFLTECQQNHILGVLTCILGIGLYRYIVTRCATTPLAVNQLILEDAYGRIRPFSTDVCMDFDILKKFLEVHYQDTAGPVGAALVKVGQFHVMLGSRRGKVFGRTDWNRNLVKSGYRIVNSVYVNKEDAKCLTCATVMAVTGLGEFHW